VKTRNQSIVEFNGVQCLKLVGLGPKYTVELPQVAHGVSCMFYVDGDYRASWASLNYVDGTTYYIGYSSSNTVTANGWRIANYYSDKTLKSLTFYTANYESTPIYVDLSCFIVELSSKKSDYEEYKPIQTVLAAADGTVKGIRSLSPNISLITDSEDVILNCTYNADVKRYIDNKISELS